MAEGHRFKLLNRMSLRGRRLPLRRTLGLALIAVAVGSVLAVLDSSQAAAQEEGRRGRMPRNFSPEDIARMRAAQGAVQPEGQPGQQPEGEQPKKEGEEKKPEGEGEKKEEQAKTIKRPTEKPKAKPEELKVAPDKDGMVQFNFRGQAWTDVLEWFAGVAGHSLDWQELPADFINLSTQRRYTIAETRDLLNRHLLARGFTMILQGDVLSVVKTDKLDPSLVPRVEPDDLDDYAPHDFVRTRFPLPDTMDPAKAVEDVKALLSPVGKEKVTPLLASQQLQVMDAVANLRDVRDLLYGEQLAASQDVRPRPFAIRHRRADYIADQVMIVLGLDPSSRKNPMELQIEQQRIQLAMQMQQRGGDVSKMLKQEGPPVHIAVDKRRNVLLVNAPPKEMEIIERTINEFDVPDSGLAVGGGLDDRQLTMRRHSTVTVDPDAVVKALQDMGDLDPLTQMQSDDDGNIIFAYATEKDHATIEGMIDRLDGSGRKLWPIWLNRRTPADQVAGTIKALMVGEPKKEDNNRSRFFYYGWDDDNDDESNDAGFRIQADVDNNRLLLWANEDEYTEVTALLKELGAIASDRGSNPNKWRILDARTPEETAEMLEKLQQTWGGRNPLNINIAPRDEEPTAEPTDAQPTAQPEEPKDKLTHVTPRYRMDSSGPLPLEGRDSQGAIAAESVAIVGIKSPRTRFQLVAQQSAELSQEATENEPASEPGATPEVETNQPAAEAPAANKAENAPPINITVTPDGRVVISSDDVAALDQLEDLLAELEPPKRNFEIFELKNSRASMVVLNLEEYFADEIAEDDSFSRWYWGDEETEDSATLGKSRKLRFIWDSDTNTIVVQNASDAQLEVIRELIKIYDQPVSEDAVAKRRTDIVPIRYSSAQDIATAIKEVYRDLLSSKDKEFQSNRNGEERDSGRQSRYSFWGSSSSQKSAPMKMSFEGALSIGVDEISNSLIISADEQIWDNVKDLAVSLDEKARPDTVVQIHQLSGSLDAEELQDSLNDILSQPWQGNKPTAQNNRGGDRGRNGDSDRRRDYDRYRRDRDRDRSDRD